MQKALSLVGFGRERVIRVPVDQHGRMRVDAFPSVDERTIVCVQAGNVNTGAFDPIEEICARVRSKGAWVHVNGAFGVWAAAAPARAHLTQGVENADSLRASMSVDGAYLAQEGDRIPYQYTPDFSRRARATIRRGTPCRRLPSAR